MQRVVHGWRPHLWPRHDVLLAPRRTVRWSTLRNRWLECQYKWDPGSCGAVTVGLFDSLIAKVSSTEQPIVTTVSMTNIKTPAAGAGWAFCACAAMD
jgi:hypothetical protein